MKTVYNLLLCMTLVTWCCTAQAKPKRAYSPKRVALENEIQQMIDSLDVVGLSVAVVRDNHIVYNSSWGVQDINTKQPVTNNTVFRIASISKSFSAVAIMQLVEARRLKLTTDVNDVLPFVVRNPRFPDVPITVEMLLSHTSSLNDSEGYYESLDCIDPGRNENYARAYNDYRPGEKYEYCNLNFSLLGSIIEKVSGERFDRYVYYHIVRPLGLEASFNINDIPPKNIAKLYAWNGKEYEEQNAYRPITGLDKYELTRSSVTFSPAGGMKISARNLARYMLMHMNYGKSPLVNARILLSESAKNMQAEHTPGYHYGLALETTDKYTPGDTLVGHTGGAYGLRSAMFFNPEEKYGLVMMCSGCNNPDVVLTKFMPILHKHFIQDTKKKRKK